ncbi:MAG: SDR family NAD(P)-dependent oxidoreductase [Xanthomonadaceae bacterium]|nr:SDR family NAD(P)-dependent oxidoreductase [Xanthomonadaceae bacterium]
MTQSTLPADYTPPADLLRDKVVLITGAAAGLGRALALQCAAHGATVVLLDRQVRQLEQLYDEIEATGGPQPAIYPLNLEGATPDDYAQLAQSLADNFARLDGLVHNAAALGTPAPIEHYSPETWLRTLHVNLNAPFLLTRACLPLLKRTAGATLIFVSDEVGRGGRAYWGAYGVAKAGLEGLMRIVAAETPRERYGLRVNSVDPGPMRTALRISAYPAEDPRRLPLPDAVARRLLYLFDDSARHLHGCALRIDAMAPSAPKA